MNTKFMSALFIAPNASVVVKGIFDCIGLVFFSGLAATVYSVFSPPDYQSSLGITLLYIGLVLIPIFYLFLYLYGDDL